MARNEFEKRYPSSLKAAEFVDRLLAVSTPNTSADLKAERSNLLSLFDGTNDGRAAILLALTSQPAMVDSQYNQSVVLLQYFGYLRRDPDETGFNFWVNSLKSKPLRDPDAARSLTCAFLTSIEYQNRFGMLTTHNSSECGN